MVKKIIGLLIILLFLSCNRKNTVENESIITVSIAPFKYFVEAIAGDDFSVNVMVPGGSDPHIYEPYPKQIFKLRNSVAYISNGYMGFELTWLDRFKETNRTMKMLSLNKNITPLVTGMHQDGDRYEVADPHYWVSPKCAMSMAFSVRDFLCELNPSHRQKYETNYLNLVSKIQEVDKKCSELFSNVQKRSFMIFHPNLGYLARDYGLEEITVEYEGKEPPPSRLRALIDHARLDGIKTIFVQREYDTKNANAIADEIGARVRIIDPLSEDWYASTMEIIHAVHDSLIEN